MSDDGPILKTSWAPIQDAQNGFRHVERWIQAADANELFYCQQKGEQRTSQVQQCGMFRTLKLDILEEIDFCLADKIDDQVSAPYKCRPIYVGGKSVTPFIKIWYFGSPIRRGRQIQDYSLSLTGNVKDIGLAELLSLAHKSVRVAELGFEKAIERDLSNQQVGAPKSVQEIAYTFVPAVNRRANASIILEATSCGKGCSAVAVYTAIRVSNYNTTLDVYYHDDDSSFNTFSSRVIESVKQQLTQACKNPAKSVWNISELSCG
jgi:hypothetical protein